MRSWPVKVACVAALIVLLAVVLTSVGVATKTIASQARGQSSFNKAGRLIDAGRYAEAVPLYNLALRETLGDDDRARAYGRRGWAYVKLERDEEAIADFTAALQINPDLWFAVLDRGLALHRQGKFEEALSDYNKAIWLNPNTVDAYRNRALIFAHRGQLNEAISDMDEAIRCAPNDSRWFTRRGQLYLAREELDPALASFESAIGIDQESVDAQYGRARILIQRGEGRRAERILDEAIRRLPNSARLFFARALIQADAGELEKAVDDCAEAIALKKDFAAPYATRARLEFQFGYLDGALAFAGIAQELDPKMPLPHQVRGRVLDARQKYAQALIEFEQAIALDSEYVSPVVWHAMTRSHAGFHDAAQREFIEAIGSFDGTPDTHLMFAWFLATCREPDFRDGTRAVTEAQRGIELAHRDPYSLDILATAYAETGEFARAEELEREALDKTPAASRDCIRMEARLQMFAYHLPYRE